MPWELTSPLSGCSDVLMMSKPETGILVAMMPRWRPLTIFLAFSLLIVYPFSRESLNRFFRDTRYATIVDF